MADFWRCPKADNEVLLGSDASKILDASSGDTIRIKEETFKVAGVLDQTGSQDDSLVFASLGKAQKILGKEGKITLAEVAALCSGCPIGDMVTQIAEKLPDAKVSAIQQVVEGRLKALDQFKRFSYAMAGVVVFIGSLIVFVTMMGSVNERTTEIGVFRAIAFARATSCGSSCWKQCLSACWQESWAMLPAWGAPNWLCLSWLKARMHT